MIRIVFKVFSFTFCLAVLVTEVRIYSSLVLESQLFIMQRMFFSFSYFIFHSPDISGPRLPTLR